MHWEVAGEYPIARTIPALDDPNEGGPRECENDWCQRPLPREWPAVYCSAACAMADA